MKSAKTHVVASAALCALTLAVTLAARDALPGQVPMQWGLTGEASINLLVSARLAGRGEGRAAMYYIAPAIALLATAAIVFLGTR